MLSPDFVAGVISVCGTFIHIKSARTEQFGFQIKMSPENFELLDYVARSLNLNQKPRLYREKNTEYLLLITRSRKKLLGCVIPFIDDRLYGPKLLCYLQWRSDVLKSV